MFWLDLQDELLCQEVILVQSYMYRPSARERGNAWGRIADSLNSIDNPIFYINQRSVRELFNLILTQRCKTKISANVRATGMEIKEQTSTENLLEELDEKIKEAVTEFETKTLQQSQKAEEEKVAVKGVRKKALETLVETKKKTTRRRRSKTNKNVQNNWK